VPWSNISNTEARRRKDFVKARFHSSMEKNRGLVTEWGMKNKEDKIQRGPKRGQERKPWCSKLWI